MSILDLLWRRVSNAVAIMPFFIGVSAALFSSGALAALQAAFVAFVVLIGLYCLWAFGFVGAADVKMAAACSACAGLQRCGWFLIYTLLVAGILGLIVGVTADEPKQGLGRRLLRFVATDRLQRARESGRTVPLAVALSVGLLVAMRL